MRLKHLVLAAALLAAPGFAIAHEQEQGPNGGQVTDIQGHHVEFTVKDKEIVLYLSDADSKPIDSKGATGRIVVLDGGKQASADLAPVEPNILSAKLDAAPAAGAKVVISAKLSDGHELQARFVTK